MDKFTALSSIFNLEDVTSRLKMGRFKINADTLLSVISKKEYTLDKELGVASTTVTRTLKYLWPEKPTVPGSKICIYLLNKYNQQFCTNCNNVLPLDAFHLNNARAYGYNSHCKRCCLDSRRDYQRVYQSERRATKLDRVPSWADLDKIKEIYKNCPSGYHVDHIVPLQGKIVSGLHVENNLQYLTAEDNIKKNNKF